MSNEQNRRGGPGSGSQGTFESLANVENNEGLRQLEAGGEGAGPKESTYNNLRSRLLARIEDADVHERKALLENVKELDQIEVAKRAWEEPSKQNTDPSARLTYEQARNRLLARIVGAPTADVKVLLKALEDFDEAEASKREHETTDAGKQEGLKRRRNRRWMKNISDTLQYGFKATGFGVGIYLLLTGESASGWILISASTGWTLTDAALKKMEM